MDSRSDARRKVGISDAKRHVGRVDICKPMLPFFSFTLLSFKTG